MMKTLWMFEFLWLWHSQKNENKWMKLCKVFQISRVRNVNLGSKPMLLMFFAFYSLRAGPCLKSKDENLIFKPAQRVLCESCTYRWPKLMKRWDVWWLVCVVFQRYISIWYTISVYSWIYPCRKKQSQNRVQRHTHTSTHGHCTHSLKTLIHAHSPSLTIPYHAPVHIHSHLVTGFQKHPCRREHTNILLHAYRCVYIWVLGFPRNNA